jgi:2-polyprenyl-6-methoxyphenol hydroxylase-like FAD-dependent oxidoreductase
VAVHFKVDVTQLGRNSVVQRFKSEPQRYEKWIGAGLELKVSAVEPESLLLFDCNFQSAPPTSDLIKDIILKTFESACPDFTQLLTAIKPRDVYFWTQPSLPRVQRWTFGRLALVGDAAHPFLPRNQALP